MSNQIVKEQMENKIQIIAEVDSTINAVCGRVKEYDFVPEEYADTVKALAQLVAARAALSRC